MEQDQICDGDVSLQPKAMEIGLTSSHGKSNHKYKLLEKTGGSNSLHLIHIRYKGTERNR